MNAEPLTGATNLIDPAAADGIFRPPGDRWQGRSAIRQTPKCSRQSLHRNPDPADRRLPPRRCSAADLDGDGQYEIILHQISKGRDNSFNGITGTPVLDAYKLDGTHLWRIDLGINIREGEHYTQFMAYDLDGDGRAEIACKTADGTKDGTGKIIGDATKDWRNKESDSQRFGRILSGPEFLTIFDGKTGAALKTVDYIPGRDPIDGWGGIGGNGGTDSYGNRCDRFLACVAYLDGKRPSLVMCRGVYGRTVLAAWDWRNGELTSRWVFDSGISHPPFTDASPFSGMGGHALSVADVDEDGKDEIIYQAMTVDDNGKGLYSTGRRHGDAIHVGDFDPDRPGLGDLSGHRERGGHRETPDSRRGHARLADRQTAVVPQPRRGHQRRRGGGHRSAPSGQRSLGRQGPLRTAQGEEIGTRAAHRRLGHLVGWRPVARDLRRVFDLQVGPSKTARSGRSSPPNRPHSGPDGTAMRACGRISAADLLGDWREELLVPAPDGKSMRLYTTTIPTKHRIVTLMHDPQYRLSIAWQNVSYNKPPHPGFHLGEGMKTR